MNIFWILAIILFVCWIGGFAFHVGGGLIHILLVVAVIVVVWRLMHQTPVA
jgi:hypothetical protein